MDQRFLLLKTFPDIFLFIEATDAAGLERLNVTLAPSGRFNCFIACLFTPSCVLETMFSDSTTSKKALTGSAPP